MNMFALSDADPGEGGGGSQTFWYPPPPPPPKKKTKKYPNSIKIWTF